MDISFLIHKKLGISINIPKTKRFSFYSMHILDCFTHLGCYTDNISAALLSGFLQVPFVFVIAGKNVWLIRDIHVAWTAK